MAASIVVNRSSSNDAPLDFSDPSQYTYPIALLEDAARLWMVSRSPTPPMIEDLIWRDRTWDNEVSRYRNMLEFYIDYESRPSHLKDSDENWSSIINEEKD